MECDAAGANNIPDLQDFLFKSNTDADISYFCAGCNNFGVFHKEHETAFCVNCSFRAERALATKSLGHVLDNSEAMQWNPYESMMPAHVTEAGVAILHKDKWLDARKSAVYPLARVSTRYTTRRLVEMLSLTGVRLRGVPAASGDPMAVYTDVDVVARANTCEPMSADNMSI
jgi:hypothetical protein